MSLDTTARVCPTCGHPDTDRQDFCAGCGEYLRWNPTQEHSLPAPAPPTAAVAAVPPPPPPEPAPFLAAPPSPASPPASVLLVLEDAGSPLRAAAGGHASLRGTIRNQSGLVDNYDFRVAGLPAEWVTLPPTAYLLPFGSGEGHEQPFEIALTPPRAPETEARAWPFAVEAVSRTSGRVAARAEATLTIEPYHDVAVRARPQRRRGRVRTSFDLDVASRGNAPVMVALSAADADDACTLRLDPPAVRVEPGGTATARLRVAPRRTLWWGRPVEHRIDVAATVQEAGAPVPAPPQVAYRQLPWIPWWVPIAVVALIALAIALLALRGESIVVPEVRGQTVEQAQELLVDAGLKSDPRLQEVIVGDAGQVGRVLGQNPAAGSEIDADGAVILQAGVANQVVSVPEVRGATRDQAQQALAGAGLTLGLIEPSDAGADALVDFQNPAAGEEARLGSPVNVILAEGEEEPEAGEPAPEPTPEVEAPPAEPAPGT